MADGGQPPDGQPNSFKAFLNPVVALAGIIVLSVLFLILCAMFGWDSVLENMAKTEYARGLITYLFAVVTIGTAVVLVVSALTSARTNGIRRSSSGAKKCFRCCSEFSEQSSVFTLAQKWQRARNQLYISSPYT